MPATSIPGLLTLFQNEWDATVLEVHQLRQALHTARQVRAPCLPPPLTLFWVLSRGAGEQAHKLRGLLSAPGSQ